MLYIFFRVREFDVQSSNRVNIFPTVEIEEGGSDDDENNFELYTTKHIWGNI